MELNKIKGMIFGLAIGDALGYPIEFMGEKEIINNFNKVYKFEESSTNNYKKGIYSDDTQMSIATINAILNSKNFYNEIIEKELISEYKKWYLTQSDYNQKRHPGFTCLSALQYSIDHSIEKINYGKCINDSKGCGGIMRVASLGLLPFSVGETIDIGCKAAYITHNHILGYYTAGYLTGLIKYLSEGFSLTEGITRLNNIFSQINYISIRHELLPLVKKAIELSKNNKTDLENINSLGEGWVAEETLAIALYCSLKYENDYINGVSASINHKGDSDSTGCVCGAILGFIKGFDAIPNELVNEIENKDLLNDLSIKLFEKVKNVQ